MRNLRPFQIVLLAGSVFLLFFSIFLLAVYTPGGGEEVRFPSQIQVWGTLDRSAFAGTFLDLTQSDARFAGLVYEEFPEEDFIDEFVNAVAEDRAPDLLVISQDMLVELRPKLSYFLYESENEAVYPSFTSRRFYDTFIEGAEIFAMGNGIYALPFAADPMTVYWNRDIFSANGITRPPTTWEQLRNNTVPRLTKLAANNAVIQSAISFGEYDNVTNATEIMSLLFLQLGDTIVNERVTNQYRVDINNDEALSFYTQFSDSRSSLYSWNKSLPNDRNHFLSGDLAMYFGYGSEYESLSQANPNLNFDIAEVPQHEGTEVPRNYARIYGLAIPLKTRNYYASYVVAEAISNSTYGPDLAEKLDMASAHRLVETKINDSDPVQAIRNRGVITARGWLMPPDDVVREVFESMIDDVTSGRALVPTALNNAKARLEVGLRK